MYLGMVLARARLRPTQTIRLKASLQLYKVYLGLRIDFRSYYYLGPGLDPRALANEVN